MTNEQKQMRRTYMRALIRRIRITLEMRQNAFLLRKQLRQAFRSRHRSMV